MTFLKCIILFVISSLRRKIFISDVFIDNPLNKAKRVETLHIRLASQCQDGNGDKLKIFPH